MSNEISYEITKSIGVIKSYPTGWSKEINMVSWNGGQPKVDIRDWDETHERMSKGITLTKEEFRDMIQVVKDRMPGLMVANLDREER